MRVRRTAQVSFEFMMVTGVALFILAASAMFMYNYSQHSKDASATTQAAQIGYTIVTEATNVYTFGNGSFVTVQASVPEEMERMYVVENSLVVELMTQRGLQTVPVFATVPIRGMRPDGPIEHVNDIPRIVHAGKTSYKIRSFGDYIRIEQVS